MVPETNQNQQMTSNPEENCSLTNDKDSNGQTALR